MAKFVILPGVHQPTTATSYVANSAAHAALPESFKAALAVAAREISGSLRQRIIVQNTQVLDKYREKGVEVLHLDQGDVAEARVEGGRILVQGDQGRSAGDQDRRKPDRLHEGARPALSERLA